MAGEGAYGGLDKEEEGMPAAQNLFLKLLFVTASVNVDPSV